MKSFWLHGWATDSSIFDKLIQRLEPRLRSEVQAISLEEYPLATLPEAEGTFAALQRKIESLGGSGPGVGLVGWSLGAMLACELASRASGLGALVVISGCAKFSRSPDNPFGRDKRLLQRMSRRLRENPEALLHDFYRSMFLSGSSRRFEHFLAEYQPRYGSRSTEPLPRGLDYLRHADLRSRLGWITCPVLVIHGGRDPVTDPRLAGELAAALPDSRLVMIEEGDHIPFLDNEERFARLVGEFFDQVSRPPQPDSRETGQSA